MSTQAVPQLLVVMAKEPRAGSVKTRLQPLLTSEEAAGLYHCFLQDRLEEMAQLGRGTACAIAYAPPSAQAFFTPLGGSSYLLFPQGEGGLSERLVGVFGHAFAAGFSSVCVIDSDSPDLPREVVLNAFSLLRRGSDAVFGPCMDGGYYLVGLAGEHPGLFQGIPWSTAAVLDESLGAAERLGLRTALLPSWRDIDTPEDLLAFRRSPGMPAPLPAAPARRTRRFLEELRRDGKFTGKELSPGSPAPHYPGG